ncbi:hypothetical protein ACFL67_01350 [candidate division KSB1 bacterium]
MDAKSMKRFLFIVAAVICVSIFVKMIGAIDTIIPEKIIMVTEDNTKLHMSPARTAISFVELNKGDKLEVIEALSDSSWLKVSNGQFTGFVEKSRIQKTARYTERK